MAKKEDKKQIKKKNVNYAKISVGDFEVESNRATLKEMEECINRLIKENKNFAEIHRAKSNFENMGLYG